MINWRELLKTHTRQHLQLLFMLLLIIAIGAVSLAVSRTKNTTNSEAATFKPGSVAANINSLNASLTANPHSLAIATTRKDLLIRLMQEDPATFLRLAKLYTKRSTFPAEVQPYIEKNINVSGKAQVYIAENFNNKTSSTIYKVQTNDQTYTLYKKNIALQPDTTVTIKGIELASSIALQTVKTVQTTLQTIASRPEQNYNAAYVILKYADKENFLTTNEQLESTLNTSDQSLRKFFSETSYGKINFTFNYVGSYTLPLQTPSYIQTQVCDINSPTVYAYSANMDAVEKSTKEVLAKNQVNLNNYTHVIYIIQDDNPCKVSGYAGLYQNPTEKGRTVFINIANSPTNFAHELGHSIGLMHSSAFHCNNLSSEECNKYDEYGDLSSAMTVSGVALTHYNAPQMENLKLLPASNIQEVTQSDTYYLYNLENKYTNKPQILKIWKPSTKEYYYLSYRLPKGFDINLGVRYIYNVSLHVWKGPVWQNPNNGLTTTKLVPDALSIALPNYKDTVDGISITQKKYTDDYIEVEITINNPEINSARPSTLPLPGSSNSNPIVSGPATNNGGPQAAPLPRH